MLMCYRRDLRKVCDRNNLVTLTKTSHLLAHGPRDFATHVCINFVKNHQRS